MGARPKVVCLAHYLSGRGRLLLDYSTCCHTFWQSDTQCVAAFSQVGDVEVGGVVERSDQTADKVEDLNFNNLIGADSDVTASRVRINLNLVEGANYVNTDVRNTNVEID